MLVRDPRRDAFISGTLASGLRHDPDVHDLVVSTLSGVANPTFVDVGANIGYFTASALAVGATTISFEPYYENVGALMSTVERNEGWMERATVYVNTLGYESSRVTMGSTNSEINLSNMHIVGSRCVAEGDDVTTHRREKLRYGIDYTDTGSLDQVVFAHHGDVRRIHLMKVDVETFEMHVLAGAARTLCETIVERIAVEVEYLKPSYGLDVPCDFAAMRDTLVKIGYEIYDLKEERDLTRARLEDMPTDVVFRLRNRTMAPATRLRHRKDNPCRRFSGAGMTRGAVQ